MADVCNSVEDVLEIDSGPLQVVFQPVIQGVSVSDGPRDIVVALSSEQIVVAAALRQAFGTMYADIIAVSISSTTSNTSNHRVSDDVLVSTAVAQVIASLVEDLVALVCAATQAGFGNAVHDLVDVSDIQRAVLTHALADAIHVSDASANGAVETVSDALDIQTAATGILDALSRASDVVTAQTELTQVLSAVTRAEDRVTVLLTAKALLDALSVSSDDVLVGSSADDGGATEAWTAPSETMAMSKYVHPFIHSVAGTGDGRFVAIGREGLYLFTPGQDDEGIPVDAVMRSGQIDGGIQALKFPVAAYGHRARGQMQVLVSGFDTGAEQEGWFLTTGNVGAELAPMRVKLGRGIRSRQFRLGVQNVDGGDVEFTQLVYLVDVTSRRV